MSRTPVSKFSRLAFTLPTITLLPRTNSRLMRSADRRPLEAGEPRPGRGERAERPGPHHRRRARPPYLQAPLDLVGLRDPLLRYRHRLEQHADILQPLRHLDDELLVLDVVLGQ